MAHIVMIVVLGHSTYYNSAGHTPAYSLQASGTGAVCTVWSQFSKIQNKQHKCMTIHVQNMHITESKCIIILCEVR